MKLYFAYDNKGRVAFYSESPNKTNKFEVCELDVTSEQMAMIKENHILYIRDNNLVFEQTEGMLKEVKEKESTNVREELRAKIQGGKMTLKELSQILLKTL